MKNPSWYGFNLLWLFSVAWRRERAVPSMVHIEESDVDFIAGMGCNFVRLPVDYQYFIHDFRYDEPDEAMLKMVDRCVDAVVSRGIHCSLNIHRAPGYCINGIELERDNLWRDEIAQKAFAGIWTMFAERYKNYTPEQLSFDLLNEPPEPGQHFMTRENHEKVMRDTVAAIRKADPSRPLIIDGICGGHNAAPELADLGVIHSTRGYMPMRLTHWKAEWMRNSGSFDWPKPEYPGMECDGRVWNRDGLLSHYAQWKEMNSLGVPVHIGECGCYDKVDNPTALRWFSDFFDVCHELGFGYALWNFRGNFGIAEHRREGTRWEVRNGIKFDRDLYEMFVSHIKI